MSLHIDIRTINHAEQRYNTVGDWWLAPDGTWQFRISKLGDWRMELCIAVHELVECALCRYAGIAPSSIDEFDIAYEARRVKGDNSEPGDHQLAPYRFQHCIATGVERMLAPLLGLNWKDYEERVNAL